MDLQSETKLKARRLSDGSKPSKESRWDEAKEHHSLASQAVFVPSLGQRLHAVSPSGAFRHDDQRRHIEERRGRRAKDLIGQRDQVGDVVELRYRS